MGIGAIIVVGTVTVVVFSAIVGKMLYKLSKTGEEEF